MDNNLKRAAGWAALPTVFLLIFCVLFFNNEKDIHKNLEKRRQKEALKKARWEYFHRMLKDPATGDLPANIRQKELHLASKIRQSASNARTAEFEYEWHDVGPVDVGGRTRALAIDFRDKNIVLAGGVSGGMWKSIDKGKTWELKSDPTINQSVTWVVQDPNNPDIWYYTMGEFRGNSGSAEGAMYQGAGIFKSVDNGETWNLMTYEEQASNDVWEFQDGFLNDPTSFTSPFDFISRIVVSPTTGSVFIASNFFGIYKSTDGGQTFNNVLKSSASTAYYDVVVDSSGMLSATIDGLKSDDAGFYRSDDDGSSWANFTPPDFPDETERSVIAFAPSNQSLVYMLTNTGSFVSEREDIRFYRLDFSDSTFVNLTDNIPQFGGISGDFNTQINYNMALSVKPDDENVVLVGGTNLIRSTDGFSTPADDESENWIGGYANKNSFSKYPNHHPDQHVLAWDPEHPDTLWSGNDGGIYKTDITNTTIEWIDLNRGYRVTQFYTAELSDTDGDFNLLGGTQDNGSPFFHYDFEADTTGSSSDVSSGDGSYCYNGEDKIYVSSQNGNIRRVTKDGFFEAEVSPNTDTLGALFIHPFAVDPITEEIMYYPSDNHLLINESIREPNAGDLWMVKEDVVSDEYIITAISAAKDSSGIVYLGAYDGSSAPKILKYTHSTGAIEDISIPGAPVGAYPHHIAVNDEDTAEFIVAFTNYNIVGTYHTTDGGANYNAIEGNLEGDGANPGPSIRAAAILNINGEKQYYLGTSTGLYVTDLLDGNATVWNQQSNDKIGYSIVTALAWREIDDVVMAATHGRGAFIGLPTGFFVLEAPLANNAEEVTDTSFVPNWNSTEHASFYTLKIADDPEMSNLLGGVPEGGIEVTDTSLLVFGLPANRKFYYTVQGADGDRRSPASDVIEVETLFPTPVAAEPINEVGYEFTARWDPVDEAELYVLDVTTDPEFENFVSGYEELEVTDTSAVVEGIDELSTYFYRVRAGKPSRNNDSNFSDTIEVNTPEITGLEDRLADLKFNIYPVPSNSYVQMSVENHKMRNIVITNVSGQTVKRISELTNDVTIDISDWKPGVYIARIESGDQQVMEKFVVE